MKLIASLLVAALLLGHPGSATSLEYPQLPIGTIPDNKGVLYVYRPSHVASFNLRPEIYINDEKQGSLFNGTFVEFLLDPGAYKVAIKLPNAPFPKIVKEVDVEIESGDGQFLGLFVKSAVVIGVGATATDWDFRHVGQRTGVMDIAVLETPEEYEARLEKETQEFEETFGDR